MWSDKNKMKKPEASNSKNLFIYKVSEPGENEDTSLVIP